MPEVPLLGHRWFRRARSPRSIVLDLSGALHWLESVMPFFTVGLAMGPAAEHRAVTLMRSNCVPTLVASSAGWARFLTALAGEGR